MNAKQRIEHGELEVLNRFEMRGNIIEICAVDWDGGAFSYEYRITDRGGVQHPLSDWGGGNPAAIAARAFDALIDMDDTGF